MIQRRRVITESLGLIEPNVARIGEAHRVHEAEARCALGCIPAAAKQILFAAEVNPTEASKRVEDGYRITWLDGADSPRIPLLSLIACSET